MEIKKRQYEIIKAAGEILNSSGIQGLTTKNLAEKIGVAEGTLYRHFNSKDEIIVTMGDFVLQTTKERLNVFFDKEKTELQQLTTFFESQILFVYQHPYFLKILFSDTILSVEDVYPRHLEMLYMIQERVTIAIKNGQKNGTIRNDIAPDSTAHIIMSTYRMLMGKWVLLKYNFDIKKEVKKMSKTIIVLLQKNVS